MARPPRSRRTGYANLQGRTEFRRLLRQMPVESLAQIKDAMREVAPRALAIARSLMPRRTGKGAQLITAKVTGTNNPRLAIGLLTKKAKRDGFYLRILEQGRRGREVRAARRKPSGGISRYRVKVKAIGRGRYDFLLDSAAPRILDTVAAPIMAALDRALARLSGA